MTEVYCKPQQKKVNNQKIQTKYMKTVTENSKDKHLWSKYQIRESAVFWKFLCHNSEKLMKRL